MSQLGFTFYPKDWWTSDTFFTLNPFERYIYLELLFMLYDNGGTVNNDRIIVERRLSTSIKESVWLKITDLMVKDGDLLTHASVNKRLARAIASRENGKKGGRPKKVENKPRKPTNKTYNNPPLEREIEREREIETKVKISPHKEEIVRGCNFFNSINPPDDGVERSWSRFKEILQSYKCSEADFRSLTALSDYGKIGHPIWALFSEIRNSNGKINQPIRFIFSRL